jgi:hypothetical protein
LPDTSAHATPACEIADEQCNIAPAKHSGIARKKEN